MDFKLPDLGEGVTEAEVDRWLVKEGDTIAEDEPLVEVITDKATAEIPSPYAGVVARIHVAEGEIAPVGAVLVSISSESLEDPTGSASSSEPSGATSPVTEPPGATSHVTEPSLPEKLGAGIKAMPRIKAMPPVRKLARNLGVDLSAVAGSGSSGAITRADVEAFASGESGGRAETTRPAPSEIREPLRGIRRTIAERMAEAHRRVPAVTHVEECDVTQLDDARSIANREGDGSSRLTYLPFVVKAVCKALDDHPVLNSSLDEEVQEIVIHARRDVGIAVDTPAGLSVPVVRTAHEKSLREIAREIERLANAARSGSLTLDDLGDATFTITSPGRYGGLLATPIVFHPQAAILGVHRAADRPVARDGKVVIRKMMNLSLTFDHRILDGLTAAKFCVDIVQMLEHPALLALD